MPSKCGIPRDWSQSEKLNASEKFSLRSGSVSAASGITNSAAAARYVNSVSDLYATDEIDALLDEIRDLQPINVHADDLQDFEIDGSISRLPGGGSMTCDSRTSVHSWDSHALYHHNRMDDDEIRIGGPVSMYCDIGHVKTPIGILRGVLIFTSMVCMLCLLAGGDEEYGVFMLPYVARIRLMLFVILLTSLVTLLLLFLDITLLYNAFPFHYHRWAIAIYTMECAGFMGSSALIVTLVQIYQESFPWIQAWTRHTLIAASVFGFLAGVEALGLAIYGFYEMCRLHLPKREDTDHLTLTERADRRPETDINVAYSKVNSKHKLPPASQNIEPPITATVWPIDDVQPCSSKHVHEKPATNCAATNTNHQHHHHHHHHQSSSSAATATASYR